MHNLSKVHIILWVEQVSTKEKHHIILFIFALIFIEYDLEHATIRTTQPTQLHIVK